MQYCDYAMSGRSDDRPNFLRMIEDAKTGMFEIILVWKMDRFARNIEEQYYYEHVLRKNGGVTFESVKENIAGTSIEATSTKALNALFAEVRSRQSAEDTMRGMPVSYTHLSFLFFSFLCRILYAACSHHVHMVFARCAHRQTLQSLPCLHPVRIR